MSDQFTLEEKELLLKMDEYIQTGQIEILDDNNLPADNNFIYQDFPWGGEYIHWESVPNSEHYLVKIPYRPQESRDFIERMIKKYTLNGSVVIYGDVLLQYEYRMDVSLLPTFIWDFMPIPICLYAVNPEQKWCFSFKSYNDLNFGYAPDKLPEKNPTS